MAKTFEESIKKLESIVEQLESGDVSLEKSIKLFEEGMTLSTNCKKLLEDAEKKVSILTDNGNGEMTKEDFLTSEND